MEKIKLIKLNVCNVIRDDGHRSLANRVFSNSITVLIIVNVALILLELLDVISAEPGSAFFYIEVISVVVFTLEYLLRLWTSDLLYSKISPARARLRYTVSPMSLVDIAAILPFYLPMAFPINMMILRLLRLLRLMRILKLNRYSEAKTSEKVLSSIKEAIILVDSSHNLLSANNAALTMFPTIKNIKKYTSMNQVENWADELLAFDESIKDSIYFDNNDRYYKADVSTIYDREKLLRYIIIIQDITESVLLEKAEKEREQADLMIASKIQASMLPNVFPPFPDRVSQFDIYASMEPMKAVGGDFYDFFFVDENKLAVVIADVSGKGIPAALFMVNAKTQLKNALQQTDIKSENALARVMESLNNLLSEGNDECMFVTVFFGVLDISSGSFDYVNGGHDVPLIKRGDDFEWLATRPGFMPGFMEGTRYEQDRTVLNKGDVLFLYTDGVTEAENASHEQFSEERLLACVNAWSKRSRNDCKDMLLFVRSEVDAFAGDTEQFDDITMLGLRIV